MTLSISKISNVNISLTRKSSARKSRTSLLLLLWLFFFSQKQRQQQQHMQQCKCRATMLVNEHSGFLVVSLERTLCHEAGAAGLSSTPPNFLVESPSTFKLFF